MQHPIDLIAFETNILNVLEQFREQIRKWLPSGCPHEFACSDIRKLFLYLMTPESWYDPAVTTIHYIPGHYDAVLFDERHRSTGDGLCAIWSGVVDQIDFPESGCHLLYRRYRSCAILRAINVVQSQKNPSTWTESLDNFAISDLLALFKRDLRVVGDSHREYILSARKDIKQFGRAYFNHILDQISNDVRKQVEDDEELARQIANQIVIT